jgi:peptidoglycan/LPS O-acetylase OafA/YrhL
MTASNPTKRRHDLDALRAVAMLLGIVLHAALSFMPGPWMAQDSQQSVVFGLPVAAIHGFRMALFFLISGYFTALLWRKRGLRELIRQRFKRIFLPCMLGLVTIVPVTWVAIAIAVQGGSRSSAAKGADDIWTAAVHGDTGKVEHYLSQGTNVDQLHPVWGTPALTIAALHDRKEIVALLLEKGAEVNRASRDGGTALHAAAFLGREAVVKLLLEKGADANLRNQNGQTAQETMLTDWRTTQFIAGMLKLRVNREAVTAGRAEAEKHFIAHGGTKLAGEKPLKQSGKGGNLLKVLMIFPVFHHLWFLWFLCWLVAGFAVYALIADRLGWKGVPAFLVASPLRYAWLIPLTLIPQAQMGELNLAFGPDTSIGLLPVPHVLGYYALFFAFGVLYHDSGEHSARIGRNWKWTLPLMLLVVFPVGLELTTGSVGFRDQLLPVSWQRPVANVLQVVFAWGMSFACIGLFRSVFHGESRIWRYMSDASYWLYLAHLPLVILLQHIVRDWPLPALVKFLFICLVTTGVLLLSYRYMVRYTWIGRLLNGPRERTTQQ